MSNAEVWKIIEMSGHYEISSLGRVRNYKTQKVLASTKQTDGYERIRIHTLKKTYYIHRLVAQHFIDNPHNLATIDHIDRQKNNNNMNNLRWASSKMQSNNIEKRGRLKRKIARINDSTNEIITIYDSISDAVNDVPGSDHRLISAVCRKKRTRHMGFKWTYVDTDELEDERWIHMPEFENNVYISNCGRIRFVDGRITKGSLSNGYRRVHLRKIDSYKHYLVHRLVAKYFIENPNNDPIINHIDTNKSNNNIDNLEWCTHSENTSHYYKSIHNKIE